MPKKLKMIAICKLSAKPLSNRLKLREKSGGNILDSNRSLSRKADDQTIKGPVLAFLKL